MTGRLQDKVAVITGAGSGIGLASARRFASEGAKVVCVDIEDLAGKAAADDVGGIFVHADVTADADVQAMYAAAVETFGGLDIAFNNAGHLAARRRLDPHDRDRCVAASAGSEPDQRLFVLQVRDSAYAGPRRWVDHQYGVLRRGDGIGDIADQLHGVQGWRLGYEP